MEKRRIPAERPSRASGEFEIIVDSDWGKMSEVNEAILNYLESTELSAEMANRYTMVACELTENGIKYGSFEANGAAVHVLIKLDGAGISVEVTNPIGEGTRSYLHELDHTIQWIRGFQDPFEAYIERMRAISHEPLEVDRSGLGLVRITYEGRSALDFFVEEDSTLSVSAVSEISP
jgi:hypothetical protein